MEIVVSFANSSKGTAAFHSTYYLDVRKDFAIKQDVKLEAEVVESSDVGKYLSLADKSVLII